MWCWSPNSTCSGPVYNTSRYLFMTVHAVILLQIVTLYGESRFQTNLYNLYPFSDLAFRQKLYYHYLDESANKTIISSNPFRIRIFLFLSYSFGTETINTFIHSCSSLENHTWFQTKMGKLYTRFQTKGHKNPTWWGGTYLYSLYKGVPHPHPSRDRLQKAWTNQLMKRPVDMTTSIALSIKINY